MGPHQHTFAQGYICTSNKKWYVEIPSRILPIDDCEVMNGLQDAIAKMYIEGEGENICKQFV